MQDQAQREKAFRLLTANPEIRNVMARALEVEEEGRAGSSYYLGWRWDEIPVQTQKLRVLVEEGLVKISYKSHSSMEYLLRDPELIQEGPGHDLTDLRVGRQHPERLLALVLRLHYSPPAY